MLEENRVINGLWIGSHLTLMEQLTLRSFVAQGHRFVLWTYDDLETALPPGVERRDAREVLPSERVFRYRGGHFPGSCAGFSDMFRYALLAERGGWWVDMDVTCLRAFDFTALNVFRPTGDGGVIGNILKIEPTSQLAPVRPSRRSGRPAGHRLMEFCYRWTRRFVDADNKDWFRPIKPLRLGLVRYGLVADIVGLPLFATDNPRDWAPLLAGGALLSRHRMAIHWCNEWSRRLGFDKTKPRQGSFYESLLIRHGLL
jgi:hypothetical protein